MKRAWRTAALAPFFIAGVTFPACQDGQGVHRRH
jgi:hypothetical protein